LCRETAVKHLAIENQLQMQIEEFQMQLNHTYSAQTSEHKQRQAALSQVSQLQTTLAHVELKSRRHRSDSVEKLKAAANTHAVLERKNSDLQLSYATLQAESQQAMQTVHVLQNELEALRRDREATEAALNTRIEELTAAGDAAEKLLSQTNNKMKQLQQELDTAQRAAFRRELSAAERYFLSLTLHLTN